MQRLRWIYRTLATVLLIVCIVYASLYVYGFIQLRRADRAVRALQSVRIGEPLPQSLAYLKRNEQGHDFVVSALPFTDFWWRLHMGELPRIMPWDWWFVNVGVETDGNGRVVAKGFILFEHENRVSVSVRKDEPLHFDPCFDPALLRHPGYAVRGFLTEPSFLSVVVSSQANPDLVRNTLAVRLDCLATKGACKPERIAPAAWKVVSEDEMFAQEDSKKADDQNCTVPKDYCCFREAAEKKQ